MVYAAPQMSQAYMGSALSSSSSPPLASWLVGRLRSCSSSSCSSRRRCCHCRCRRRAAFFSSMFWRSACSAAATEVLSAPPPFPVCPTGPTATTTTALAGGLRHAVGRAVLAAAVADDYVHAVCHAVLLPQVALQQGDGLEGLAARSGSLNFLLSTSVAERLPAEDALAGLQALLREGRGWLCLTWSCKSDSFRKSQAQAVHRNIFFSLLCFTARSSTEVNCLSQLSHTYCVEVLQQRLLRLKILLVALRAGLPAQQLLQVGLEVRLEALEAGEAQSPLEPAESPQPTAAPKRCRFGEEISTSEEAGLRSAILACRLLLASGMFLWFSLMCLWKADTLVNCSRGKAAAAVATGPPAPPPRSSPLSAPLLRPRSAARLLFRVESGVEPLSRLALESGVAELMEATLPSAGSGLAALEASSRKISGQWMHCRSARSDSCGCLVSTCFSSSSVWLKVSSQ
ncbi:hypothetical protein CRUP_008855 [Coryphaenoides rupestris]|nr:hypothetical protein CRUP_008855 [Coryphaenoides rupestris]